MKNKFSTIYSIFASVIFVLAIFYFGFNLYSEYSHGYLLRPSSIRFYARNAFFVVLIVVIITIIMIITISANEKNKQKDEKSNDDEISLDDLSTKDDLNNNEENQNSQNEDEILENSENQTENSNKQQNILDEKNENQQFLDKKAENQNSTNSPIEEKSENIEKTEEKETKDENQSSSEKEKITLPSDEIKPQEIKIDDNNPYGLFSPKTGIGWESYLLTRLDNELNRAISLESDLAVFVIKVEEIEKNTQKLREVCDYLISQFQFKDMLFEYKEDCIVALKTSINLDEAITIADKLHSDIEDISSLKCYIGISTRTIRIITGERLLQEATEALQHAQEEKDAPIIAFRANAEKYREFLEKE